jgi:hypothetical protein
VVLFCQYLTCFIVPVKTPRAGAFSANFNPETLDRFRDLCKLQSKSYSKVLERLAELYLETGGAVLKAPFVPAPAASSKPIKGGDGLKALETRLEKVAEGNQSAMEQMLSVIDGLAKKVAKLEKEVF